jgi:hypothetical protein
MGAMLDARVRDPEQNGIDRRRANMHALRRIAALLGALGIMLTGAFAGTAATAAAAGTPFQFCDPTGALCLQSEGPGAEVSFQGQGRYTTNFQAVNGRWVGGLYYTEYQQAGSRQCLEFDPGKGDTVIMHVCVPGKASQEFTYFANGHAGQLGLLLNLYAGSILAGGCMYHSGTGQGSVYLGACYAPPSATQTARLWLHRPAGPAPRYLSEFHWCDPSTVFCITNGAVGSPVAFQSHGAFVSFMPINGQSIGGVYYVEYERVGTSACLAYDQSLANTIVWQNCQPGLATEQFSYTGDVHTEIRGFLENLAAASAMPGGNGDNCMFHDGTGRGAVSIGACNVLPGSAEVARLWGSAAP